MLIITLMGGLGYQLFQIFTCISYAIDNNLDYRILEFMRMNVGCDGKSKRNTYWNNLLKHISHKTIKSFDQQIYKYKEPCFQYKKIPIINDNSKNYTFFGYFQSPKYFENNLKKILDLINLNEIRNNYINHYDYKNTISIHFRIGDLIVGEKKCHGPILTIDYYKKSLKKLINDTNKDNWKILYFYEKNDENRIVKNINNLKKDFSNLSFIPIDHKLEDWEQMLCMSLCRHNIIANSTFSWWGAYLNENKNNVYYPKVWFGTAVKNATLDDLILKEWIKID